ncbi:2115_t:CDS:1, partial [Racocetra persica]
VGIIRVMCIPQRQGRRREGIIFGSKKEIVSRKKTEELTRYLGIWVSEKAKQKHIEEIIKKK